MKPLIDELDSLVGQQPVNRRGFVRGSLATGFAAAVAPTGALLAQTIMTDTSGLMAGEVRIPAGGVEIPAYRAMPFNRTDLPTVIVVHEIFSVHEYIKDVCRRLAKQGYLAIAPDFFARQGDVTRFATIPEIFANVVSKVPDAQVMSDIDATAAWAASHGGARGKLGVTGFCWGGRIVWLYAAHQRNLQAGVAWYGRLMGQVTPLTPLHPIDVAEKLNAPVLGLYGGKDDGIPLTTVDEKKTRLSFGGPASRASEFMIYPDAPHAFHADYRPSYRKDAADDAFPRALAWFRRHGVA